MFDIYTLSRGGQHLSKTLTLFNTKICGFPCPVHDLTKHLKPYLRSGECLSKDSETYQARKAIFS